MERDYIVYVGTYAAEDETGILKVAVSRDQRSLELVQGIKGISNPSYLALSEDGTRLYAVMEDMEYEGEPGGGAAVLRCGDGQPELLNTQGAGGTLPCYILLDEGRGLAFTANYMSGSLSMFPLLEGGMLGPVCDFKQHHGGGPNPERQEGPHVHFAGFSRQRDGIWCVDLGSDRLVFYEIDENGRALVHREERDIRLPGGTGPRHFASGTGGKEILYIVCELSSEVYVVDVSTGKAEFLQRISTLPENHGESTCAAVKMSEDGRYLYASNRGDDSIAAFGVDEETGLLNLIQIQETGGRGPRDFLILEDMILAANQDSGRITMLHRDEVTGLLAPEPRYMECHAPVCLVAAAADGIAIQSHQ